MNGFLWVAIGGAIGASARYGVSLALAQQAASGFPWATLVVNVLGGFAMGLLAGLLAGLGAGKGAPALVLLLGTGVLGGFTTFSAFSIETLRLVEQGATGLAAVNVAANVTLSLAGCAAGLFAGRALA